MKSIFRRTFGLLIALAILGALFAPRLLSLRASDPDPEAAEAPAPPLPVEVYVVHPEALSERLATTGTLRANEGVEVVSEISGKVVGLHFEEGSRVEAGRLLVEIDAAALEADRERILYQVTLAERRAERQSELRASGVLSEDDYELAANRLSVLRAELAAADAGLAKTRITAPFAGVVGLRRVSLGGYLTPQTLITTLQDLDTMKLDFTVPEKYSSRVRKGMEIEFRVAGAENRFTAEVYAVEPTIAAETRSLLLRARCRNREGLLLPGAFAEVEIVVREVADALSVPAIAVIPEMGGNKVFVFEDGKAVARRVETGIRGTENIEILSGLDVGEKVIVSAIPRLRSGLAVAVERPTP